MSPIVQTSSIHVLLTDVVVLGIKAEVLADQLQQQNPDLTVTFMSGYTQDQLPIITRWISDVTFLQKLFIALTPIHQIPVVLDA